MIEEGLIEISPIAVELARLEIKIKIT